MTTLRAAAFLTGYAPTNTDTQTYLFSSQVLAQTPANATAKGWPTSPVNGQVFNFGMDPAVISSFTAPQMLESLHSLPTLSVVTDQSHLTNAATGIYVNADQHGSAWERPISLELIHPPGYVSPDGNAAGFQINAGLRMRGGYSRNDQFFKHGMRLFFSGAVSCQTPASQRDATTTTRNEQDKSTGGKKQKDTRYMTINRYR